MWNGGFCLKPLCFEFGCFVKEQRMERRQKKVGLGEIEWKLNEVCLFVRVDGFWRFWFFGLTVLLSKSRTYKRKKV